MIDKIKNSTRAQHGKEAILAMIRSNQFTGNKLPSEDELTRIVGVSLATLREALLELNNEGVISKRHGSGNFVHPSTLQTRMRIDRFADFINLLEDGGYEARSTYSPMRLEIADRETADAFRITPESKIVVYERNFYAGDRLAICAQNRIPLQHFVVDLAAVDGQPDLGTLIWRYCRKNLAHGIQEFMPTLVGQEESLLFQLKQGEPMISWKEIFYTVEDLPICLSRVKFNPVLVKMKMLWKWGQKA
jgi:GntR family transcriptional regulator